MGKFKDMRTLRFRDQDMLAGTCFWRETSWTLRKKGGRFMLDVWPVRGG